MNEPVLEQQIAAIVCRLARLGSIEPEQNYFDAGLASVQALELLLELESAFNVSVPDDEFAEVRTVRALANLVSNQGGAA